MYTEILHGICTQENIEMMIGKGEMVSFKAKRPMVVGKRAMLKVNANIGVSDISMYKFEVHKLETISTLSYRPDSMMDNSIIDNIKSKFWTKMVSLFDGPVGTLPHYLPYSRRTGIDKGAFWDNFMEMCEGGVSFMTLHPTAAIDLLELAKRERHIPTTSRGGAILLSDTILNNRDDNLISDNFDDILTTMKKYGLTVSIGSVFRPASIVDALDSVHMKETQLQKKYIDAAKKHGVPVIMEGIGHIPLKSMNDYFSIIDKYETPLMPLGPLPSDNVIGFDHVSSAIGATYAAIIGNVGIINSITKEEHTGGVPNLDSIIEGIKTSRTVAHIINISRFPQFMVLEETTAKNRAEKRTCILSGGIFDYKTNHLLEISGCSRCSRECPLTMNEW